MTEEAGESSVSSDLADSLKDTFIEDAIGDLTTAYTQLDQAESNGVDTDIDKARAEVEKAKKRVLDAIAKATGIPDGALTQELVDQTSDPDLQGDAKDLQDKFIEPALKQAEQTIRNAQTKNGERGNLQDSPKTKMELLKKYGPTGLKLLLAIAVIGFGIYELDKIASQMSGCYKFSTNTPGTPEKIGCSEDTCSCQNIIQCGPNNTPCTQANGVQYMWQEFSSIDALCQLPKMVMSPIASGLSDLLKPMKEIVGGVLIIAVVLFILYVIYKNLNKKISN